MPGLSRGAAALAAVAIAGLWGTDVMGVVQAKEVTADGAPPGGSPAQDAGRRASLLLEEERLFLRGCAGDAACAAAKHAKLQAYRESLPDVYSNLTSGAVDGMIRNGAVLLNGQTCSGHTVFLVRNRLFDWARGSTELLQWQVYNHETLFHYVPASEKGIVVVQDVSNFELRHMWAVARSGGLGLLNYFDQHIVGIIIVGEPSFFGAFWRVARMLLPERARNMITMLGQKWEQLPGAVQVGDKANLCREPDRFGPVEASLRQLPSDGDLGGIRVGSLPLEIPLPTARKSPARPSPHGPGDSESAAEL